MRKIICLIVFLLFAASLFAMDREDLRTEIRHFINDKSTDTARQRWSDTILNERINLAQYDIAKKTWCCDSRIKVDISTTTNTSEILLTDDFFGVIRCAYEISSSTGYYKRLNPVTRAKLDKDGQWEDATAGEPTDYYIRRSNILGFYPPIKGSTYGGDRVLQVDYSEIPDELTSDTQNPFNEHKRLYCFHQIIIWYVADLCLRDNKDPEADKWKARYDIETEGMREELNIKPDREGQFTPEVR